VVVEGELYGKTCKPDGGIGTWLFREMVRTISLKWYQDTAIMRSVLDTYGRPFPVVHNMFRMEFFIVS
jgi:hypothetical protein